MKEQNNTNTATSQKSLNIKIKKQVDGIGFCWYGVLPFIGNMNMLGNRYLGLTPKEILKMLRKNKFFKSGRLLLGICLCGCEGCDDFFVDISINNDSVTWKGWHKFEKVEYISALQEMKKMATECLAKHKKDFKEYKKAVYECLTQNMGIPATVAKNKMKFYEKYDFLEQYFMKNRSIQSVAMEITTPIADEP